MKVCPNNPAHQTFVTSASVMQDWLVDGEGNFIELVDDCTDVFHKPDTDNLWTCATCGADAREAIEANAAGGEAERLRKLVREMGHVIRSLDEEGDHVDYWTNDGNEHGPEYNSALSGGGE